MASFRKICGIFLLMVSVVVFNCCSSSQPTRSESLVVGLQSGYPPFEYMNQEGKIVGFDVELAGILAEKLGKKLVVQDMEFEGEILSLKQGKIDLIISGMNITPSRLREIDMIPYHGDKATSLSLLFWNEIPNQVTTLEELGALPRTFISVESGSIPEEYLTKFPKIRSKSFQGALSPLMDVKFGKSTANLVQPDVAVYLKSQHPEIKVLNITLSPEDQVLGFGIGIKKGNSELQQKVEGIIQQLRESGELKKLEDKWFKGETH